MKPTDVRPEEVHLAAQKVHNAGEDWGESTSTLSTDMNGAGDPYGKDELGSALHRMYQIIGPTALKYFAETGFCLIETGTALDQMAAAYTVVERDNTGQLQRVQKIVYSLGDG